MSDTPPLPPTPPPLSHFHLIGPHRRIILMIGAIHAPDQERRGAIKAQWKSESPRELTEHWTERVSYAVQSTDSVLDTEYVHYYRPSTTSVLTWGLPYLSPCLKVSGFLIAAGHLRVDCLLHRFCLLDPLDTGCWQ